MLSNNEKHIYSHFFHPVSQKDSDPSLMMKKSIQENKSKKKHILTNLKLKTFSTLLTLQCKNKQIIFETI